MKTSVLYIMANVSEEEARKMIKDKVYTIDGRWTDVYMERRGDFYEFLMVMTRKGRYFDLLENKDKHEGFIKLVEFTSDAKTFEEVEEKAKTLCPDHFEYLYTDLVCYIDGERTGNVTYKYRAMYEIK